jgi:hypothetical protein
LQLLLLLQQHSLLQSCLLHCSLLHGCVAAKLLCLLCLLLLLLLLFC